ncbi:MAG: hypothetical protein IPK14_03310 [Blastocatellia bacterium]|nr:hypothetical protein [Blastocatellia bacterium]
MVRASTLRTRSSRLSTIKIFPELSTVILVSAKDTSESVATFPSPPPLLKN